LAAKANLAGGNTFTGIQTITGGGSGVNALRVNTSTGTNLVNVTDYNTYGNVTLTNSTLYAGLQAYIYGASDYGAALNVIAKTTATQGIVVRGRASQSASLQEWQNSAGTIQSYINSAGTFLVNGGSYIENTGRVFVNSSSAAYIPLTVRGTTSQTGNLQEWQNSAGTVLAYVNSGGTFRGPIIQTIGAGVDLREGSGGGGLITAIKMGSLPTSPGANAGRIYFRDGTTTGTLKLVVRAGAAGAETTILDNIPQ
jgi:hypothetical protein